MDNNLYVGEWVYISLVNNKGEYCKHPLKIVMFSGQDAICVTKAKEILSIPKNWINYYPPPFLI
jgi:hypothetical protein